MVRLLDALAAHTDPVSLKELVVRHGAASVDRAPHPERMVMGRFVDRPEAGSYRLGMRLLELGNLVKARLNVREAALDADARTAQADPPAGQSVGAPGRRDRLHRTRLQRTLRHAGGARHRRPRAAASDLGRQAVPAADEPQARARLRDPHRPGRPHTRTASPSWRKLERELAQVRAARLSRATTRSWNSACAAWPPASTTIRASWSPACRFRRRPTVCRTRGSGRSVNGADDFGSARLSAEGPA